jgi:hypothetical protein
LIFGASECAEDEPLFWILSHSIFPKKLFLWPHLSYNLPDILNMRQKVRSHPTDVPEDIQMPSNGDPNAKKRGHDTDTEDPPRKKAKQGHETDNVRGKKVRSYQFM